MADSIIPSDISDPERIFPTKAISSQDQRLPTGSQAFSSFMKGGSSTPTTASSHISPLAMMQGSSTATTTPNPEALLQQVNKLQATSSQLQDYLKTPHLKLKASTKYLLKNKFTEANENISALNSKLGARMPGMATAGQMTGPFGKFINYLNSGQEMMNAAKEQLQKVKADGTHMAPSDFLLVQLKLNKAQQLLEFSSVLLSNAVSDIKQFMQIQI